MNIHAQVHLQKEQAFKKQMQLDRALEEVEERGRELDVTKRQVKGQTETIGELQMQLSTMKQIKEKYEELLEEQEGKARELKQFNSSIMKEKEIAIKNEIIRNDQLTEYENKVYDIIR